MRTERIPPVFIALLILLLLGGGWLVGRRLDRQWTLDHTPQTQVESEAEFSVFRNWLWERRGLDLLVQVALVFAGTLGVAAILPNSSESPASLDPGPEN
jgi:hypothetical protein